MPNWCSNTLYIDHPDDDVRRKIADLLRVEDKPISFDGFLPTPPELKGGTAPFRGTEEESAALREKYGADDWYDWQVKNWGTKWNPVDGELDSNDGRLFYTFNTAWGPPMEAISTLSKRYPEALFTLAYDEPGMDFGGYAVFQNGKMRSEVNGGSRMSSWGDLAEYAAEDIAQEAQDGTTH